VVIRLNPVNCGHSFEPCQLWSFVWTLCSFLSA